MARRIYRSFADEVNSRTFECIVPVSYFRQIPFDYKEKEVSHEVVGGRYGVPTDTVRINSSPIPTSFYNPINPNQRESARIAIPDMVDLHVKKTFCEVIHDLDIMHILHLVDEYLLEVREFIKRKDPRFIEFAKKLVDFRQDFVYPCFRRNIIKYPGLLREYKTYNTGMSSSLMHMFSFDDRNMQFRDGVDKLRNPPYSLSLYIDPPKTSKTVKNVDGEDVAPPDDEDFMGTLFKNWSGELK